MNPSRFFLAVPLYKIASTGKKLSGPMSPPLFTCYYALPCSSISQISSSSSHSESHTICSGLFCLTFPSSFILFCKNLQFLSCQNLCPHHGKRKRTCISLQCVVAVAMTLFQPVYSFTGLGNEGYIYDRGAKGSWSHVNKPGGLIELPYYSQCAIYPTPRV